MTSSRIWAGVAAAAGIALTLGTGVVAANAESVPTTVPTTVAAASAASVAQKCSAAEHLEFSWHHMPATLRTDLKALRAMDKGAARRADAKSIRAKALAGTYGPGVEAKAEWLKANKGEKLRPLPGNLKADLKSLKGESKADRAKTLDEISTKAVDGTYGAKIESFAKFVESSDAWKACTPPPTTSGS